MTAEVLVFAAGAATVVAAAEFAPRRRPRGYDGAEPPAGGRRSPGGRDWGGGWASVAWLASRALPRRVRADDLERRLVEAGRPGRLDGRDFLAAKLAAGMAAATCGLAAGTLLPGALGPLAAALAPAAGFLAPDLWLARRRAERAARVRRDLPPLLDLLRVSVQAGLPLTEALAQVGRGSSSPLARAWAGVAAQVRVGVPLAAALESHRRETALREIDAFAAALARAARHGAPLEETLAAQAREARLTRVRAIQEAAAKAGPKMQLVVALLLVPSVMLLVAAALLGAVADGGAAGMLSGF